MWRFYKQDTPDLEQACNPPGSTNPKNTWAMPSLDPIRQVFLLPDPGLRLYLFSSSQRRLSEIFCTLIRWIIVRCRIINRAMHFCDYVRKSWSVRIPNTEANYVVSFCF